MKNGGTPLHWAKSKDIVVALIEAGCIIGLILYRMSMIRVFGHKYFSKFFKINLKVFIKKSIHIYSLIINCFEEIMNTF